MKESHSQFKRPHATAEAYFKRVAHEVFDNYFSRLGATVVPVLVSSLIKYATYEWFAEILYLPSDGPNYSPRVEIGVLPEPFVDSRRNRIDVLHTIPPHNDLRRYNLSWRYTDERGAKMSLAQVRDEIVHIYALPYLQVPSRLRELLSTRRAELDREWEEEIRRHNDEIARVAAEEAFRTGDYVSVIRHLMTIQPESLTFAERKRLDIARQRQ